MPRLVTYNVHSFIGTDRRREPERIAHAIRESGARVVALQEVRWSARSQGAHALQALARGLGMDWHFQRTATFGGEQFGLAILSDLPMRPVKGGPLPRLGPALPERRSALWVEVDTDQGPLQVICTHLAVLSRRDRMAQAEALLGPDWLGAAPGPAVLMGDLNAGMRTAAYRRLAGELDCARSVLPDRHPTYPSWMPLTRIDHIMGANGARLVAAQALRTPTTRVASDHLPFVAEVVLDDAGREAADQRSAGAGLTG
ncbi:endonuclease/exonuclease/phosphatase family protein [Salinarimonas ramus]|uniref:Endonuclease n=1 Tax=Salinarimonas ramus TaxID=690164 RepID=A0A917V400_9HYPH|nr:endonuclease/exonuclease/phosphatase family protein [Salinarimonas ramus]GGK34375.1 endonuclease [Salinarimonas ramus]